MRAYLDWNATAPPHPDVLEAMRLAAAEGWGNPASVHAEGRAARRFVESAREAVATLLGKDARDVILTGGGTEANNLAIVSAMSAREENGKLLVSRLEHPSVLRVAERYEAEGRVRWLRVAPSGAVDVEDVRAALEEGPVDAVALLAVSHETGVVQPLEEVIALAHARGAWVHVDAVQAIGRVQNATIAARGADSIAVAGHKLRGPKGIGALATRAGARIVPVMVGGGQEKGLRPGTVDAIACAGFAVAVRRAEQGARLYASKAPLRDRLETALAAFGAEANVGREGRAATRFERAPHVASLAFAGFSAPELVAAMDLEGVAISAGPACSAGTMTPSVTLTAMHGEERARRSVRISLGETTEEADVDFALAAFERVLRRA